MRFLRAEALFLFKVSFSLFQNLVDEKFRSIFMVCYKNVRRHPYYSTFIYTERNHPQGKVVWIVINCS